MAHARTGRVTASMRISAVNRALAQKPSKTVRIPPRTVHRSSVNGRFVAKPARTPAGATG